LPKALLLSTDAKVFLPMSMAHFSSTIDKEYVLPFDLMAMSRLATGTAFLVATVLCIPDAIAILPNTHNAQSLIVRVCGMWLAVFVQWLLAFLGILHLAAIINRGVVIGPSGIRLTRFSKLLRWSEIAGIGGDVRPFVTKLTLAAHPAIRMHIFVKQKNSIKSKNLDSLFFDPVAFASLVNAMSSSSFGLVPASAHVVITNDEADLVKAAYKKSSTKSKLLSVYIAMMLVLFTGRGAARNYFYNMAGQSFNLADYRECKRLCQLSLSIDSTYPYALDRLARCEYRMQDIANAEEHWRKALKMKPDFVSAKVGLSNIYIQRRQFDSAKSLLKTALRLEPQDIPVHLNLGYAYMQTGNHAEAMSYFERALKFAPDNPTVKLLSAQAYLSTGASSKAESLLQGMKIIELEMHHRATFARVKRDLLAKGGQIE
jgi:hypothetical protein